MLYNKQKRRIKQSVDCGDCKLFDKTKKKCKGFGINCFEFDPIMNVAVDPVTKLPITFEE